MTVHFQAVSGVSVNGQVVTSGAGRTLLACDDRVSGVTLLTIEESSVGLIWMPTDRMTAGQKPLASYSTVESSSRLEAMFSAFAAEIQTTLKGQQAAITSFQAGRGSIPSSSSGLAGLVLFSLPAAVWPAGLGKATRASRNHVEDEEESEVGDESGDEVSVKFSEAFLLLRADAQEILLSKVQPVHSATVRMTAQVEILKKLKLTWRRSRDKSFSSAASRGDKSGLIGVAHLRRRYRKKPGLLIRRYLQQQREISGVGHPRTAWHLRVSSRRPPKTFGVIEGFSLAHVGLQEVIWIGLEGQHLPSVTSACQPSQLLHQVALDPGDWWDALPLIPVANALLEPLFGGKGVKMRLVKSYKKAPKELKSGHTTKEREPAPEGGGGVEDQDEGAASARAKKKAAWKPKQRQKE